MKLMKKRDLTNPKTKDEFKKRILSLYDDEANEKEKIDDPKYDRLMGNFDRISKVISAQQVALDSLDKKVSVLQKRREEREKNPDKRANMRK